ncbi:MAG: family 16 glycosylhydrolase, partial [Bacteroidota bacterium]
MRAKFILFFSALLFSLSGVWAQCPNLVWSDEFDGTSLNTADWNYQIGDGCPDLCGWGNGERQFYQENNVTVSDGTLKIEARLETIGNSGYTSARITTRDKQDFTYGRMEARIKLPPGAGTWPAFWMLPTDEVYGGWPQSGEIDIMEYIGREPDKAFGTIHYGDPFPANQFQGNEIFLFGEEEFHEDFHTFAIEWEEGEIRWFMDDYLYSTKRPINIGPFNWPFDQDFHFLLNLAIGGTLGGLVNNSVFPVVMEVDYVRVYDGNRPYIVGNREVENAATGQIYRIRNIDPDTEVNWSVPSGATIVSGQGTSVISLDWGTSGGTVTAEIMLDCGVQNIALDVFMEPTFSRDFSFENFDDEALATLVFNDGDYSEVNNPDPNEVNNSNL